jgi:hypothetical protein
MKRIVEFFIDTLSWPLTYTGTISKKKVLSAVVDYSLNEGPQF